MDLVILVEVLTLENAELGPVIVHPLCDMPLARHPGFEEFLTRLLRHVLAENVLTQSTWMVQKVRLHNGRQM